MRASKENARQAQTQLAHLKAVTSQCGVPETVDALNFLDGFLQAAERKLPTEAAFDADASRGRAGVTGRRAAAS